MWRALPLLLLGFTGCRCPASGAASPSATTTTAAPGPSAASQAAIDAALQLRAQGDSERATTQLLAAATRARETGDRPGEAWAIHRAGDTLLDQDRCGPARARYLEALGLHQQLGDRQKLGLVANDLGLWSKRCDFEQAAGWFSLAVAYRRDEPKLLALSANNLGQVFWNDNRADEAQLAWDLALEAAARAGEPVTERKVLSNLALLWVLRAEGHYDGPDLDAAIEALVAGSARDGGAPNTEALLELLERRDRRRWDVADDPAPIDGASPALARARDYFRRALDAARRAGEDPIVVCGAFGTFASRCQVLTPAQP